MITGEGRLDASSWSGKVVGGVVGAARHADVPVLVVAGAVGPGGIEGITGTGPEGADSVVTVRDLTDLFGAARATSDPSGAVHDVVATFLDDVSGRVAGR